MGLKHFEHFGIYTQEPDDKGRPKSGTVRVGYREQTSLFLTNLNFTNMKILKFTTVV